MKAEARRWLLRVIDALYQVINRHIIFRQSAQEAHDRVIRLLSLFERIPLAIIAARFLHTVCFLKRSTEVGGAKLSQRMILAAGLVKGEGFVDEDEAMRAVNLSRCNILPGWRIVPALLGPVEFGSFTRHPRLGNPGVVMWRQVKTRSTQNRVGLRNPGARAAAAFLGARREKLPAEFGINIAVSPGVENIEQQERDVLESLAYFLDASVLPTWFTLNLSCPNTEDDPLGHQLEDETKRLCGAFVESLRTSERDIPLWVKISPGLANQQYAKLLRVFNEVGVRALVATNTLAQASPDDDTVQAGVGGGDLYPEAVDAVRQICIEMAQYGDNKVDLVGCGGILDGASFRRYKQLGVEAAQYWSALVFRGPFAAAIIESEIARYECEYEAIHRQSLA